MERAGCRRLHLDIMDGRFAAHITFGAPVIASIRKVGRLFFQAHLMVERPERHLTDFAAAGVNCIIVHEEACSNTAKTIRRIKRLGLDAGVALRPKTPLKRIAGIAGCVDIILIMTVEPGSSGQAFIPGSEKKIRRLKAFLDKEGLDVPIGVDGGINIHTAARVKEAGATYLIAGSAVFRGQAGKNIRALYRSLKPC